ncbi:bromo adjacent homology (BAH) domain, Zinc finger, RING/FYVE/PHD-type [Artemisia annua]|uniref:Bromo adjacent homology (BAH) domain, Zinc finger, RING/FYVE/PHD-type n=1 Tax=Artemisia annua TaxID=35608 RepID=A0A2U1QPC1_ARTAN|nr:bromo adjacent homology (BAH) domain, Zinc finger, RING/FYVE/PHD-type [Artemisia annua]
MLFIKAKKKKEQSVVVDTKQPPFQSRIKSSSGFYYDDRKREKKIQKSLNGIVYEDPEIQNKKRLLILKSREEKARFREKLKKQELLSSKQPSSYTPTFWLDPSAKFFLTADSNERVKRGDSVLVSKSPEEGVYPALVGDINYEDNDKIVVVERYYSPEQTLGGRRSFHGNKELIATDHLESISSRSIQRKCFVHSFFTYTRLKHVGPYDYFSRFHYMIGGGWLTPDPVDVFCKCLMPFNPDQFMLKCQDCKERYHPACINMTDDEAKQIDSFKCDECRSLDVNQASSSADPDIKKSKQVQPRSSKRLLRNRKEQRRSDNMLLSKQGQRRSGNELQRNGNTQLRSDNGQHKSGSKN